MLNEVTESQNWYPAAPLFARDRSSGRGICLAVAI
jgi:hypothetical protein